jgi:hypothetical protein
MQQTICTLCASSTFSEFVYNVLSGADKSRDNIYISYTFNVTLLDRPFPNKDVHKRGSQKQVYNT